MLKKTGILKDDWLYKIVQKDKLILIVFSNGKELYKFEEYMEMAGFGINDYSIAYLQYLLDTKIKPDNNEEYKPTVYH